MDSLFLDTNVLLDAIGERAPFFDDTVAVFALLEIGKAKGAFGGMSLATIDYVLGATPPRQKLAKFSALRKYLDVAPLGQAEVDRALKRGQPDFEDGLQWESAKSWGATHLLTRNVRDFPVSRALPVLTPTQYLEALDTPP